MSPPGGTGDYNPNGVQSALRVRPFPTFEEVQAEFTLEIWEAPACLLSSFFVPRRQISLVNNRVPPRAAPSLA